MAGVTKDEGSPLASMIGRLSYKTLTKEDFKNFVLKINGFFHSLNVESVVDYYLNNTDLNDSDAIKWKINDIFGDILLKCPTYLFAKQYAEHSSEETGVYFYGLTHTSKGEAMEEYMGIFHGSDIDFVFGNLLLRPNDYSEEDIQFTEQIVKYWTDFAKYG